MKSFLLSTLHASVALALTGRTTPPSSSCLVVSRSATSGQYSTIQAAVNKLSTTSTSAQCIFVNPGLYNEQVLVPSRAAQLSIYGYTEDVSNYQSNQVTISASKSDADGLHDDETGTLRVKAANFRLYNVDVNNNYGVGSQAVALSATADSGYYGCSFTGYQATLLASAGNQVYSQCLIQGSQDFIYGQTSVVYIVSSDIRVLAAKKGHITLNGRDSSSSSSYFLISESTVDVAAGNTVAAGAYYLGEPWYDYARVVFQYSYLSNVINPAGWDIWTDSTPNTGHVTFGEYQNNGAGASGTRASFAKKLTAAVTPASILGSSYTSAKYYDATYF